MSSAHGFVPKSLSEAELRSLLMDTIESAPGSKSTETFHARYDHPERGLTIDDVIHGLQGPWTFQRSPEFNNKHWQWKYRLAAKTLEDEDLTIIVAVDTTNRTFEVITRCAPEQTS